MQIKIFQSVEVSAIKIDVPVRYGDEDMPFDAPMRDGDRWGCVVDLATGQIKDWPIGRSLSFYMKVCDEGIYSLIGPDGQVVVSLDGEYIPHGVIPGEWGDYIDLEINENGLITNWLKKPDLSKFQDYILRDITRLDG